MGKFAYGGYTLTTDFKNDFSFSMTASNNLTGQHFSNENVELTKIKKDTVLATLSYKNQKSLKCEFQMVDVEPRKLVVAFIVNFDFLPQFKEYITLEEIKDKQQIFNKISSAEIRGDVTTIQSLLDSLAQNGLMQVRQKSTSVASETVLEQLALKKGRHLLQMSGILTCTNQQNEEFELSFESKNKNVQKICFKTFCQYSYGYPYSVSKVIECKDDQNVTIKGKCKSGGTTISVANNITTLIPLLN